MNCEFVVLKYQTLIPIFNKFRKIDGRIYLKKKIHLLTMKHLENNILGNMLFHDFIVEKICTTIKFSFLT